MATIPDNELQALRRLARAVARHQGHRPRSDDSTDPDVVKLVEYVVELDAQQDDPTHAVAGRTNRNRRIVCSCGWDTGVQANIDAAIDAHATHVANQRHRAARTDLSRRG